jgi:hypothetical protein
MMKTSFESVDGTTSVVTVVSAGAESYTAPSATPSRSLIDRACSGKREERDLARGRGLELAEGG